MGLQGIKGATAKPTVVRDKKTEKNFVSKVITCLGNPIISDVFLFRRFDNGLYFFFLISHQFYTHQCIHVNPNHPVQHTTIPTPPWFSPLGVHTFVLYICVSTSALQTGLIMDFKYRPECFDQGVGVEIFAKYF